jgi:hypothetical protein
MTVRTGMIIMLAAVLALPGWVFVDGVAFGGSPDSGLVITAVVGVVYCVLMLASFAPALKIVASRKRSDRVRPVGVAIVVRSVVAAHGGAWALSGISDSGLPTLAAYLVAAGGRPRRWIIFGLRNKRR